MGRDTKLRPGGGQELAGRRGSGTRWHGGEEKVPGMGLELVPGGLWRWRMERGGGGGRETGQQPDPEGHRKNVVRRTMPAGEWIGPIHSPGERDDDALLTAV